MERRALIKLEDLHKSYNGTPVLRGVTVEVFKGETLCIIGGSGCGKTVTLKHIIGLERPDAGRVLFDGRDLSELSTEEMTRVRMRFGMVFQGGALFDSLDVGENVAFPLREHTHYSDPDIRRRVGEKLALVGLAGAESKMPVELSGGMKKRVALARAIALDPEVVLYDEPTTGLDPVTADVINELIVRAERVLQTTSVVVTHDMASVNKVADRVVMLYEGRVLIEGTTEQIHASADPIVRRFIEGRSEGLLDPNHSGSHA